MEPDAIDTTEGESWTPPEDNSGAGPVVDTPPAQEAGAIDTGDNSGAGPVAGPAPEQQSPQPGNLNNPTANALGGAVRGGIDAIKKMLAGENAVSPDVLDKVVSQSPGDTPADKLVNAIHVTKETHGDDAAMALLAGARVKYQTTASFARTALLGTGGKPADLNAAIQAANQAQDYLPDGSNIRFAPGPSGVVAKVQMPGSRQVQTYSMSPQQFAQFLDVGKDGQFDKMMNVSAPATLQRLAATGAVQGGTASLGRPATPKSGGAYMGGGSRSPAEQQDDAVGKFAAAHPAPDSDAVKTGVSKAYSGDADVNSDRNSRSYFDPGSGDQPAIPGTHDEHGHYLGPQARSKTNYGDELEARSTARFGKGNVNAEPARQQWMAGQEKEDLDRQAKIEAEQTKGAAALERAKATGQSRVDAASVTAAAKTEGWKFSNEQKFKIAMAKLDAAAKEAQDKNTRSYIQNMRSAITADVAAGRPLNDGQQNFLKKLGAQADSALSPQAPTPQAPTPQASAPSGQQHSAKDQQAMAWARANPKDPRAAQIMQRLNGAQ